MFGDAPVTMATRPARRSLRTAISANTLLELKHHVSLNVCQAGVVRPSSRAAPARANQLSTSCWPARTTLASGVCSQVSKSPVTRAS